MKKHYRIMALLLALVMLVTCLAGCSKNDKSQDTNVDGGDEQGESNTPKFVYAAKYYPFDTEGLGIDYINSCVYANGKFYFTASYKKEIPAGEQQGSIVAEETNEEDTEEVDTDYYVGDVGYKYENGLFSVNIDGTDAKMLENYKMAQVPDGMEGSANLQNIAVGADGSIWVLENVYTYYFDLPEDFDEMNDDRWNYYVDDGEQYYVRKLDNTGAEIGNIDISSLKGDSEDYFYLNRMILDKAGNLYLQMDNKICVLDGNGAVICTVEYEEWIQNVICLADGTVYASVYGNFKDPTTGEERYSQVLMPIDLTTKSFGESIPVKADFYNMYPGSGEYDLYYTDNSSFMGYKLDTQESTKIFSWINCDVDDSNLQAVVPLEDGRVIGISSTWNSDYSERSFELISMELVDSSTIPQKETVTYACMYMDYNIRANIIEFNKTNEKYRVEVLDYSEYNTEDDYQAGLTKLSTEILSGKVPDILNTSGLPIERYGAKGLLEDLWPWIEQDTELGGRDGVVEPVFDALSNDSGELYSISSGFTVYTVSGNPSLVGNEMGWTLSDLMAAYSKMPAGCDVFYHGTTKSDIMSQCCYMSMDEFVNWETGECKFNTQDFVDILKFTDLFPETYDWEKEEQDGYVYESDYTRFRSGKQMLNQTYLYSLDDYNYQKMLFGDSVTFIGYPNGGEGNGSAFNLDNGLAMSSQCQNKEGAWAFMRVLLTEDYQDEYCYNLPTNKKAFDNKLKDATTTTYYTDSETGEQVENPKSEYWIDDETTIKMYALRENEVNQIMELINSTDRVYSYDETLYDIIMDECGAFFAGQKTAEQTAELVQNRMMLYVNEQR